MKYIVVLGDGMADYPFAEFGGKTALEYASTPNFDRLASEGELGLVQTIPEGFPPGSDTANLSVIGYNPLNYYTGRSPFEAASMGIDLKPGDVSFRCNLVTLSPDEPYPKKKMIDYCSGEISTEEAKELIDALKGELETECMKIYAGFRYRHVMVWEGASDQWQLTPPHDISGRVIEHYLPAGSEAVTLLDLMEKSYTILANHPVNQERLERGLKPANSIWIWGDGKKPLLPLFKEKYGLSGAVISAVDLIKGLGLFAGLERIDVEGATGDIDTNFEGKVSAALEALNRGHDFVYLHIEAPDECSHRFEAKNKIKAIELIDEKVVQVIRKELEENGTDFSILLVTDHATPLSLGTHTSEPVPYAIYRSSNKHVDCTRNFNEVSALKTGRLIKEGYTLMDYFLGRP
ncbi:MAG: cofactor-independent phosphoglycerate mutase [Firmicutes bacterium]|nr:cofactor-independent phosphoglycerate mutase [Bacillota bacterium]